MKNMPHAFSINFTCLQISLFKTGILYSFWAIPPNKTDMHRWNIFLIALLSMPSSPQIEMVKPPDKKAGISDRLSFLRWCSIKFSICLAETVLQHSPGQAASKVCWLTWFIRKIPKILRVLVQDVLYGSIMKAYVLWRQQLVNDLSVSAT